MPDDLESDIQATAEDVAADATDLHAIEAEKATLDPDDPRALELASKAEQLGRGIASKTTVERELVTLAQVAGSGPDATEIEPEA
jgi:hypothetical protein